MQLLQEPSPLPNSNKDVSRLEKKLDSLIEALETVPSQLEVNETPQTGLATYWSTLKRRKFLVLSAGIFIAATAWYYSERQPKLYLAHTTLEILEPDRGSMNIQHFNSGTSFSQETYLQTQISLLQSRSLIKRVEQRLVATGVVQLPNPVLDKKPSKAAHTSAIEPFLSPALIGVAPVRGTRLIQVAYTASSPELAATIANDVATEYIQQDVDARVNTAEQTRTWLQKQLEDTKDKLESSEARLQDYAKSSGLLYTSPKGNAAEQTEDKLQFLARDLSESQARLAGLQAKYETLVRSPDSKVDEAESSSLHQIQSNLLDLQRQRAALNTQFTSEYAKVKELDAQIASLKEGEAKEYSRWLGQLWGAYKTEQAHKNLLEDAYTQQAGIVGDQATKAIHYNVLKREVETNRNLYDALLTSMKEAGVNASARVRNARVVDAAEPPLQPYGPKPIQMASMGLIAGLMLGATFVLISETGDRRVKSPGMAPSYLNVPELGVIPSTKPHLFPTARRSALLPGKSTYSQEGKLILPRFTRSVPALKGSPVFEAFHSAVTSILSPGRSVNVPQVLVITSGSLHEGKSTVIGNLGLMAAEIGQRVVLIDGDLRNPQLHHIYRVPNEQGLSGLLLQSEECTEETLANAVWQTEIPGLSVLPSGPITNNVASMLHSQKLTDIITDLRTKYDLILIDTPPVLPFADARIFGKLADAVILVVRAGQTTLDLALAAKARFTEDGLPVFGTILNDWNGKQQAYEYGGDHAYRS